MPQTLRAELPLRKAILDVLIREADFEGIVIIAQHEISDELGVHKETVRLHLQELEEDGLLTRELHADGPTNNLNSIQLTDGIW